MPVLFVAIAVVVAFLLFWLVDFIFDYLAAEFATSNPPNLKLVLKVLIGFICFAIAFRVI